jgi:spore coat protein U-like protein
VKINRHFLLAQLFACSLLATPHAEASFGCSVTVVGVNFGAYDPLAAAPDDSAGRVDVTCSNVPGTGNDNVSYTVTLSPGAAGVYAPRQLAAGNGRLAYNLFRDSGRSQIWGNGNGGTFLVTGQMKIGPGSGNSSRTNSHDVHGRVPPQQDAAAGAYGDTIVVTLTF